VDGARSQRIAQYDTNVAPKLMQYVRAWLSPTGWQVLDRNNRNIGNNVCSVDLQKQYGT
jgi:hypothetical protein